jgi:hypothetical protein
MRTQRAVVRAVLALALSVPLWLAGNAKAEPTPQNPGGSAYKWPESIAGKSLDKWIEELRRTDPSVKENALRTLPLFGPPAKRAVPEIVLLANNDREDVSVRINACLALMMLEEIPPNEKSAAVRALVRRLTYDAQTVVRLHAAMALGTFEQDAKEAIPGLIPATKDAGSWEIRRAAIRALAVAGKGMDEDKGPDSRATTALLEVLRRETSARVRLEAVRALGTMGKPASGKPASRMIQQSVIVALQKELRDSDRTIAVWANAGLLLQDRLSDSYLDTLLNDLKTGDVPTRGQAARALSLVAPELKKQMAAKNLKDVTDALVNAAKDTEPSVIAMVCLALDELKRTVELDRYASGVLTELKKSIEKKKLDAYVKAVTSDGSDAGSPDAVAGKSLEDWIKDLKNRDPSVRESALRTLPQFGNTARKAAHEIIDLANNDSLDVSLRVNACIALMSLSEISPRDRSAAVRALVKRMKTDRQAAVKLQATLALGHFEKDAKEAIPDLIAATKDLSSWEIRQAAIHSLAQVGRDERNGPNPQATAALLDVLRLEGWGCAKVRLEAVVALGSMGQPGDMQMHQRVKRALVGELAQARDRTIAVWACVSLMLQDKLSETYVAEIKKLLKKGDVPTRAHSARALGLVASEVKRQLPAKEIKDLIKVVINAAKDPDPSVAAMACWALGELSQSFDPGSDATKFLKELSNDAKLDLYVKEMATAALKSIEGQPWKAAAEPTKPVKKETKMP